MRRKRELVDRGNGIEPIPAVEQDFREERIVAIEGWSLAVTEARLIALIAASTPR